MGNKTTTEQESDYEEKATEATQKMKCVFSDVRLPLRTLHSHIDEWVDLQPDVSYENVQAWYLYTKESSIGCVKVCGPVDLSASQCAKMIWNQTEESKKKHQPLVKRDKILETLHEDLMVRYQAYHVIVLQFL
jgi:hypothetical protein